MRANPNYIISHFESPLGNLGIVVCDNKLIKIDFTPEKNLKSTANDAFSWMIHRELSAYFKNANHPFNIPFVLNGTPFQQKVWRKIQQIPKGEAFTYGKLASELKSAPRAIGQACRTNPIPIIIPCHRVVAANHLGGFSGKTEGSMLNLKHWLLHHEGFC